MLLCAGPPSLAEEVRADFVTQLEQLKNRLLELSQKTLILRKALDEHRLKLSDSEAILLELKNELELSQTQIGQLSDLLAISQTRSQTLLSELEISKQLSESLKQELLTLSSAFDSYKKAVRSQRICDVLISLGAGIAAGAALRSIFK